ncbi:hypothetical protein QUA71_06970 [Microcoleus sp. MON1_C5]|uniref:hypothetical protein n=1 Tax=Microcoleus sp. MON1_C5 TaxID=2818828 RepID=UPI002FD2B27D
MKDADAMFVTCPYLRGTGNFMLKISKSYSTIAADLGFTPVADPGAANAKLMSVSDALGSGEITRIRAGVKGTATKPAGTVKLYCSTKEVAGAMSKIGQKLYGGNTITSVGSIRRAHRR